jgi:hypothetical protein
MNVLEEKLVGNFSVVVYDAGNELRVEALMSLNAPEGAEHLPAKVVDKEGRTLWKFDKYRYPGAFAWLRDVDDFGPVIVYATRGELIEVISVSHLPKIRIVRDSAGRETYEGGLGILQIVELKQLMAEDLDLQPRFTPNEMIVIRRQREQRNALRADLRRLEVQAREVAYQALNQERRERVAAILARKSIAGFTVEGQRLTGIPVIEGEYEMLPRDTFVIVVASYDPETGECGDLVEHFSIKKSGGGRVSKNNPRPVTKVSPAERQPEAEVKARLLFEIGSDFVEIGLYRRADIDALHAAGLNSATKVGLFPANPDGTVTIYEVTKKQVRELGRFQPMN